MAYVKIISIDYTSVKIQTFSKLDSDGDGKLSKNDVIPFFKNILNYFSTRLPFITGGIIGWIGGLHVADEGFHFQGKQLL